jgi:hypothetical protein
MVIRDDAFPQQPIHFEFKIKRHKLLILIRITQYNLIFSEFDPKYLDFEKEVILNFLDRNKLLSNQIENYVKYKITPDEEMNWITESNYQSYWIEKSLSILDKNLPNTLAPVALIPGYELPPAAKRDIESVNIFVPKKIYGRDKSICLIDYIHSKADDSLNSNINNVRKLRDSWNQHKKQLKKFDWLTDRNPEKIEFFWNWLTSKNVNYTLDREQFSDTDSALIYFDKYFNEIETSHLIENAKKIWSQKQYREKNKNLKQCNFSLDLNTVSKLNKLAEKHQLTRTEIIKILIDSEAKSERYINERIDRVKHLI